MNTVGLLVSPEIDDQPAPITSTTGPDRTWRWLAQQLAPGAFLDPAVRRRRRQIAAGVFVAYLVLALIVWVHAWTGHAATTSVCGCGDPALFEWFLAWPAYAIAHGHSLFYSDALFYPRGVNLLSNTSVLAIGVPLTPITWLFGPVATLNVASTLMPLLSAIAAYWCAHRFVRWTPAAVVAGLIWGFSPVVLGSLVFGHLMTAAMMIPPLVVGCLDELLIRRRRHPVVVGVVTAVLLSVQFFLSTEVLVIMAMMAVPVLVALVVLGCITQRPEMMAARRHLGRGIGSLVAVTVVLLAYPAWFAIDGRAHLSSPIWPALVFGSGNNPSSFVKAHSGATNIYYRELGGYFGTHLPPSALLGWGMLGAMALALVLWWRDLRLWMFAGLGALAAWLSVGSKGHSAWRLLAHIPMVDDIIEQRLVLITYLAVVLFLAIALDHVRYGAWRERFGQLEDRGRLVLGIGAAGVFAVVALGQLVVSEAGAVPIVMTSTPQPAWFADVGAHLHDDPVILAYPAPFSGLQASMYWQAIDGMHWIQVGGGGPGGTKAHYPDIETGYSVIQQLAFSVKASPVPDAATLAATRKALVALGADMVVIPAQRGVAPILAGRSPAYAAYFFSATLGVQPKVVDGAWVFNHVKADLAALVS